jgi:glycosyltransferase involved in cell wall biosynthesis
MRILIVSDHYPPAVGGAERQTRLLGQIFRARGDEVAIAVPWYGGAPREKDDAGVAVHRVRQLRTAIPRLVRNTSQRHAPPFPDPVTVRDLRRVIRAFAPDIVHSHGWMTYSCAVALRNDDTPLLVTARDYGFFCANRTLVHDGAPCSGPAVVKCLGCAGRYYGVPKGWIAAIGVYLSRPLVRRRLAGIHSISTFVASTMREHLLESGPGRRGRAREFVIPSFRAETTEVVDQATLQAHLDALPTDPFILFVGGFRRVKGIEMLLAAYERLVDPPPLVLIGTYTWDGPTDFPPNVTALTRLPHSVVMAVWDRALFGATPSLWPEPFGSVVHEGMSRGKPVIGTDHGGHSDMIVDGENGRLVPPGDVYALTQAMRELIEDPALRDRLGRAARDRAQQFSSEAVIPRFIRAFEEVAATRRRNGDTTDAAEPVARAR